MSNANYYWGGNNLQNGSQGGDVSNWQTYLKNKGYFTGNIDGIYGPKTLEATKAFQRAYGIGDDGIAGPKTMAAAGFLNYNTPVAAPTLDPAPTYTPNDTTPYGGTVIGKDENGNDITDKTARDNAYNALTGYGNPNWDKQEDYKDLYQKYMERDPFSYDFNADALYQQYKDRYMQQGKMAMQDVMGQAAAMTGGYGNSYAASVGNQAYQQSLQQLNDVIPELYQLALSKHNQEGQDMLNALGVLESDRDMYMEDWQRGYNRLNDAYDLADGMYKDNASMHYTDLANKNAASDAEFNAALGIWEAKNTNAWKEADWNETQRLDALDRATETAITGSPIVNNKPDTIPNKGKAPSGVDYDNGGYASDVVKKAQDFVGLTGESADGMWGPNSAAAAKAKGYNSLAEVIAAMDGGGGFTGSSYDDAVAYVKEHGGSTTGIMTAMEWRRRKASYAQTGQGSAEVKNYSSYKEYLADITEYLTSQ